MYFNHSPLTHTPAGYFFYITLWRRRYAELKAADPGLKLVPLLLAEWELLYPNSQETVRSFLVRIRFLKSNKEVIKLTLGQHDLLPKMSQVNWSAPLPPGSFLSIDNLILLRGVLEFHHRHPYINSVKYLPVVFHR